MFGVRGVVEGFYGPPWAFDARRDVLSFLAPRGMNAYVYAPKDDPYHRARWRDPYPSGDLDQLLDLHRHCAAIGIRFGFALSPGLDVAYDEAGDRDALWAKLAPFIDAGVDWIVLAFDDVPLRPGAGAGQAALVGWVSRRTNAHLTVVPTDYVGTRSSPYLDELCGALPPDVDLMWTGTTVVPPRITAPQAEARRAATGGRPVLIWDNYPVNDAFMAASLHLGPLRGREARLADVCVGVLANPMSQARASMVALATVADFLTDPEAYDPAASWERALADLGGQGSSALRALARACSASLLATRVPMHDLIDAVEEAAPDAARALRAELEEAAALPRGLPESLVAEVQPWADQASREASTGLAALKVFEADDSSGDPWSRALAVMGMLLAWSAARNASDRVAFGARFACYPGIVLGDDGRVTVDPDLSLVEDTNALDRLCRLALAQGQR